MKAQPFSFNATTPSKEQISFDAVLQAMEHWRGNKAKYGSAIPDELWSPIFQLSETFPPEKIRQVFAISKKTYDNKYLELRGESKPTQTKKASKLAAPLNASIGAKAPEGNNAKGTFVEAIVSEANQQPSSSHSVPKLTKYDLEMLRKPQHATSSFLDLSTIIAEFIRADGQRMKLHATAKSFRELIQIFFEQGGDAI